MEPLDLTNMDEHSAKEYVLALITSIKATKKKRIELEKEVELWESRVKLAETHSRLDLRIQAEGVVEQKKTDLYQIKAEEAELNRELRSAQSQLKIIQNRPEFSINADLLLAELEMVVGEIDETGEHFRAFEAEQALEKLKRDMQAKDEEVDT